MGEVTTILHLVTNGGAIVLLTLVAVGLYRVARDVIPAIRQWLAEDTAAKIAITAKLTAIEVKVELLSASLTHVRDAVSAEGADLSAHITAAERRITATVRREQASDPPAPPTSSPAAASRRPAPAGRLAGVVP